MARLTRRSATRYKRKLLVAGSVEISWMKTVDSEDKHREQYDLTVGDRESHRYRYSLELDRQEALRVAKCFLLQLSFVTRRYTDKELGQRITEIDAVVTKLGLA